MQVQSRSLHCELCALRAGTTDGQWYHHCVTYMCSHNSTTLVLLQDDLLAGPRCALALHFVEACVPTPRSCAPALPRRPRLARKRSDPPCALVTFRLSVCAYTHARPICSSRLCEEQASAEREERCGVHRTARATPVRRATSKHALRLHG